MHFEVAVFTYTIEAWSTLFFMSYASFIQVLCSALLNLLSDQTWRISIPQCFFPRISNRNLQNWLTQPNEICMNRLSPFFWCTTFSYFQTDVKWSVPEACSRIQDILLCSKQHCKGGLFISHSCQTYTALTVLPIISFFHLHHSLLTFAV